MPKFKTTFQFILSDGYHNDNSKPQSFVTITNISLYHFLFIGVGSLLVLFFPMFWLIIIMPVTIISLILTDLPFKVLNYFSLQKRSLILPMLNLLNELNILRFFISLYSIVFYTITKVYYFFFFFCYGLTIVYIITSRYYFYHKVVLREEFSS